MLGNLWAEEALDGVFGENRSKTTGDVRKSPGSAAKPKKRE